MEIVTSPFLILVITFYMVTCGEPIGHVDTTCVLHVTNESRATFTETILHKGYNFMYMKLDFTELSETVKSLDNVICPDQWVWTYKGEGGGHEYLFLPRDFGYLSFGLLWSKSNSTRFPIQLYHQGNCSGLTVGHNTTDQLIGDALGRMTSDIAERNEMYNSSYWCYYKKMAVRSSSLNDVCENAICTLQTMEYRCCKFVLGVHPKTRRVECSKQHYHFNTKWWILPIVGGAICFAFYPLFLSIILRKISKLSNPQTHTPESSSNEHTHAQSMYIRLQHDSPVSFLLTVVSPFQKTCWPTLVRAFSLRLIRVLILIIPLTLSAIGTYLDAKYSPSLIKEAVAKGVIVDFSSMIAGFGHTGRYLYILGGPFIAVGMYFTFGTMLLTIPESFGKLIDKAFSDDTPQRNQHFILRLSLQDRERLGRLSVVNYSGFKRLHNFLLAQFYMILNGKFWHEVLDIFKRRWTDCVRPKLDHLICVTFFITIFTVFVLPFYVVFCMIELLLCFLYFSLPVVSCFFIIMNTYVSVLQERFSHNPSHPVASMIVFTLSRLIIALTIVAFCITWFMNCIIFFDGFWLLSRVAMFTYMGIVQFPELSYGYIILVFMAIYYIMESIDQFGAAYTKLLEDSIEISKKVQDEGKNATAKELVREDSIPKEMFDKIVEKHMPRRVQVFKALIKAGTVIAILWISVDLLITFDKFQELSELTHVFTIMFVSALPKICSIIWVKQHRDKSKQKLKDKIYRTVNKHCGIEVNIDTYRDTYRQIDSNAEGERAPLLEGGPFT